MVLFHPTPKAAIGGARRLLVAAFAALTRAAYADTTRAVVTALDPAPTWYAYGGLPLPTGTTWSQPDATSVYARYNPTLTLPLVGLDVEQRAALLALTGTDTRWWLLVEDLDGAWWWLGQSRGLRATVGTSGGTSDGQAANGSAITFTGAEPILARCYDADAALALYSAALD